MSSAGYETSNPDLTTIDHRAPSVARLFLDCITATPHAEAFRLPDNGGWVSVTWQQVGDRVRLIAAGLISLGVAPEERVAFASSTRYEWVLVDFAVMCAGAATTVYPTTNAHDAAAWGTVFEPLRTRIRQRPPPRCGEGL